MDSMLDILDSFNLTDNEPDNGQSNELQKEPEKPIAKPDLSLSTKDTKGLVKDNAGSSETYSTNRGTSQSESAGSQTGENSSVSVSQKVLPTDTFDDWKKKYNYAGWDEFSKQFGYTPPQKQALENKQQNLKRTAMLKAFTNAASELGKVVGYEQGGMVRKKEYAPLKEIEEAKQAEAEYVKNMDAYNKQAMNYELALRDKYADYLQSMATQINTSKGQSTSQSENQTQTQSEGTQSGQSKNIGYTNPAHFWHPSSGGGSKTNPNGMPETYPITGGGAFYVKGKDKNTTYRAYQAIQDKKDIFTEEEQKYLDGIVTNLSNANDDEKYETEYRYVVAAGQILLDHYYEAQAALQNAENSKDPELVRTAAIAFGKKLQDVLKYVQKTGIDLNVITGE